MKSRKVAGQERLAYAIIYRKKKPIHNYKSEYGRRPKLLRGLSAGLWDADSDFGSPRRLESAMSNSTAMATGNSAAMSAAEAFNDNQLSEVENMFQYVQGESHEG